MLIIFALKHIVVIAKQTKTEFVWLFSHCAGVCRRYDGAPAATADRACEYIYRLFPAVLVRVGKRLDSHQRERCVRILPRGS